MHLRKFQAIPFVSVHNQTPDFVPIAYYFPTKKKLSNLSNVIVSLKITTKLPMKILAL